MISSSSSSANLCLCLLCLCYLAIVSTAQQKFKCREGTTCRSLVGYRPYNGTTISDIQKYFGVRNLRTLLGANNLPISTPRTYRIQPKQLVSVPIPCICFNGTGVSNRVPIYTVQPGDGLYYIATTMFSGLVEYPKIQEVNKIPDPDLIDVGQKFWIPLPCSCEEVDGEEVVHYAHVVQGGSTVEEIADEFGTTNTDIYKLNGIASNAQLIEGKTIDIPLRACNSSVKAADSLDYPLLVSNGTYIFTANNCVKCSCDAANNWTLQCEPSGLQPSPNSNWSTCPSMQCQGDNNLYMGNTTTTNCDSTTCAYAGFSRNQTIFTTLATQSTCPSSNTGPGSSASKIELGWNLLFCFIHIILLCVFVI